MEEFYIIFANSQVNPEKKKKRDKIVNIFTNFGFSRNHKNPNFGFFFLLVLLFCVAKARVDKNPCLGQPA